MKKVFFTLLIGTAFSAAFAQTSKAIIVDGSFPQIGDFNPSDASVSNLQILDQERLSTIPRDFIYDPKNGHVIFQDKTNSLVFGTLSGSNIKTRNFNMMNTVMAPSYIPSEEKIVCFNVQREFNGYGSNEDNLFLSTIDVNKGTISNLKKFSELSFNNVSAPFFGKVTVEDRFKQGGSVQKEVAISKPLYIPEKDIYMVMIKDVTATNRLYKIHINSKDANISSIRCEYNIIDMTYVTGTDIAKTLFFEKSGSTYQLKVGDFNINTNAMTNISLITTFNASQIDNGSIKFNNDQTQLYVSRFDGANTNIYSINTINNQTFSTAVYDGYVQYDFGFNESYYKPQTYANTFGLYPNPSSGMVYFKNNTGLMPNSISVYDNLGQLVRSIKVEEITPQISIDLSGMAIGIYHVKVDMPDKDFIGKVAITN